MDNLEFELQLAKDENVLLRLTRGFENSKKAGRDELADEIANGLVNKIPALLALLDKKVQDSRNKVLSMSAAPKEERVAVLNEIRKTEADKEKWNEVLLKVERYLGLAEEPPKPEFWEEKPKRPDVKPLPLIEKSKAPQKPMFMVVKKKPASVVIEKLLKIASSLDQKGFHKEADELDALIASKAI